jgi:hypothetical protein
VKHMHSAEFGERGPDIAITRNSFRKEATLSEPRVSYD